MKLDVESGVLLAASGNARGVEEQWMAALEHHAGNPAEVASWAPMLGEFAKQERYAEAEPLAWAAVEAVQERSGPQAAVQVASAFLLMLNKSADLKAQVAELYRTAYGDRPGFEALLAEAGVAGSRPPRRAVRTMEVCLALQPGGYLVGRHEGEVMKVDAIDHAAWEITVSGPKGPHVYGPVALADDFFPAEADDFRVLRRHDPEKLQAMLADDPASVVVNILRAHQGRMDSEALQATLVPQLIPQKEWSKWWTKARTALKRHPNVTLTGRSPHELTYSAQSMTLEGGTEAAFKKLTDALAQLSCVESYLRECKTAAAKPDRPMLERFRAAIEKTCHRQMRVHSPATLGSLLVLRNMAVLLGAPEKEVEGTLIDFLRKAEDPAPYFRGLPNDALWPVACGYLRAAYPDSYADRFAALLPEAPISACEVLARGLADAGWDAERFDPLVQRVLKDPVENVEGLAWLWQGPSADLGIPCPPLAALCSKLLWAAGEIRRNPEIPRDVRKRVQAAMRDAFAGRSYARFKECLEQANAGLASSWRTQIARLDNVGRALPEDLINLIREAFPELYKTVQLSPWKRDDVLYVTSAGRRKFEAEMDELVNVKMRANAIAIGEAASHGDLSENSEYKFALEERDLLRARLAQMQEQLSIAVVCTPEEVPTDQVGFGARVTFRSETGGTARRITFLGPWEARAEQDIYNYKSPLGQSVMGLAVGEKIDLPMFQPPDSYSVQSIENALTHP